jgi:rhodanese-related sulfurtransferase
MTTSSEESRQGGRRRKGFEQFVADAKADITLYSVEEGIDRHAKGDAIFVDVRDAPELVNNGRIPGAVHASRGMLEFHIDPESQYFLDEFGRDEEFVFVCAVGGRSALAAQRAKEMGLRSVASIEGGFNEWTARDGPIEDATPTM